MKRLGCILLLSGLLTGAGHAQHEFGAGINYWKVVDDIDVTNIDDSGVSYYASYSYRMQGPLRIELVVEQLPDRFGYRAHAPQAFLLVGSAIYAGAGVGGIYADGSFSGEPFYALKAGVSLPLFFWLRLDLGGQYRFNDFADLQDDDRKIGTDTVFLGGALRLQL
ncbi:MAG: hypothetical protein ACNA71_05340 [Kiritimatiellia bacterium]